MSAPAVDDVLVVTEAGEESLGLHAGTRLKVIRVRERGALGSAVTDVRLTLQSLDDDYVIHGVEWPTESLTRESVSALKRPTPGELQWLVLAEEVGTLREDRIVEWHETRDSAIASGDDLVKDARDSGVQMHVYVLHLEFVS